MSAFICIMLILGALWLAVRATRPKPPKERPRFVYRSPEQHAQIVAAHKAEHDKIVGGAWKAKIGDE